MMSKPSVFLDVDPTILERNMKIMEENPVEKELNSLFSSTPAPRSKLVKPTPGFCVKTHTKPDNKKLFVNICLLEDIPCPKDISADELMLILHSEEPSSYRVPMSIGEGRTEYVKSGAPATVYDVAINPTFFKKVTDDNLFQTFFLTVVFEGLQDKYQCEMEMQNYIILQNRKAMGTLQSHRIELRDIKNTQDHMKSPLIQEILPGDSAKSGKQSLESNSSSAPTFDKRKLTFKLRKESLPGEEESLVAEFKIPNNVKADELRLEVGEDRVLLQSGSAVADFFLPCAVDQDNVVARLNRNNETLSVRMPTVH